MWKYELFDKNFLKAALNLGSVQCFYLSLKQVMKMDFKQDEITGILCIGSMC